MVKSIKYLNENTVQKQGENEKRRLLEESKLKREIESIKTANNSKIYKYQFNGWNYKVQKVEIVGDDKIRVKIVETPPDYYDIKEAKYQGVKLIQGADVVVDIESLINYNR
jgi:preprotein translocase subunit SecD